MPLIERPNILFCVFDSLSLSEFERLTESNECPTLKKLKVSSSSFTRAYTPCPESSPARASLFTGLDPCVHGLWTNGVSLPETERTFPKRLAQAGYASCLIGRRQLAGVSQWTTEQIPPDEYTYAEWAHGALHRSRQNAYLAWLQQTAPDKYANIFEVQANPANTLLTQQQCEALESLPDILSFNYWIGERLTDWIDAQSSTQPFLAVAGFSVGSLLGTEPPEGDDSEAVNPFAMHQADLALEKIQDLLESKSIADGTVIIVTAGRGNKSTQPANNAVNEQAINVPLLIHRHGQTPVIIDQPISTIDMTPTVLELAGAPIGPRMQGQSLLSVLNGSESPRGWAMSRLRISHSSEERNWQTALCTPSMKLVVYHSAKEGVASATYELFNLDDDPKEQHNLADMPSHAYELEHMMDILIDARCALEDRTEPRIVLQWVLPT